MLILFLSLQTLQFFTIHLLICSNILMSILMKHLKFDCSEHIWQNSDNRTSSFIIIIFKTPYSKSKWLILNRDILEAMMKCNKSCCS